MVKTSVVSTQQQQQHHSDVGHGNVNYWDVKKVYMFTPNSLQTYEVVKYLSSETAWPYLPSFSLVSQHSIIAQTLKHMHGTWVYAGHSMAEISTTDAHTFR